MRAQKQETAVSGGRRAVFPLYAKILLGFLLNMLLIGVVAVWLLRSHFGVDQNWLLSDAARDRLHAMSQVLTMKLEKAPAEEWGELVSRTGETHRVRLALVDVRGNHVAGDELSLPPAVLERVQVVRRPVSADSPPMARGPDRTWRWERRPPRESGGGTGGERRRPGEAGSADFPKEAMRTADPRGYWFLVRLPGLQRPPVVLVGMAETLGETGLLFDPKPWLWAGLGLVGMSLLLWLPFARGVTRSLGQMTRVTEEIARGDFKSRVDEKRRDELGQLGVAINRMTTRLDGFVTGQKRFMGDVAHELCSPLVRMEVALGILEQRIQESEGERLKDVQEEVDHMRALVSELLAFSKAGLREVQAEHERIRVGPLLRSIVAREAGKAEIEWQILGDPVVHAPVPVLEKAVSNLVRNAVQHGEGATPISIGAAVLGDTVTITVSDRGPGVPEEVLPQLFDPFFRVDTSRTRATGGVGLGLAIAKSSIEMCGGQIRARNNIDGGFAVELRLPGFAG